MPVAVKPLLSSITYSNFLRYRRGGAREPAKKEVQLHPDTLLLTAGILRFTPYWAPDHSHQTLPARICAGEPSHPIFSTMRRPCMRFAAIRDSHRELQRRETRGAAPPTSSIERVVSGCYASQPLHHLRDTAWMIPGNQTQSNVAMGFAARLARLTLHITLLTSGPPCSSKAIKRWLESSSNMRLGTSHTSECVS